MKPLCLPKIQMKIAILYQKNPAPVVDGILKPTKEGGYADSGADIAFSLKRQGFDVILPIALPDVLTDLDWVFPDTEEGIQHAIDLGADTFWLNTVLYRDHPIEKFINKGFSVVGQIPSLVDVYDDKIKTNVLLSNNGLKIPAYRLIGSEKTDWLKIGLPFPLVVKPIRGRGSQGVKLVVTEKELLNSLEDMFEAAIFGDKVYVEEFLAGEEITISVMPPGKYEINGSDISKPGYWCLPPVKRMNHKDGIAPYNGVVAVTQNSIVMEDAEVLEPNVQSAMKMCVVAARLVQARAVIRIDCRADDRGNFYLFDLNMKPNMTGASRPHRSDQDSLTAIASRKIGWSFDDFLRNMLNQCWSLEQGFEKPL